MKMEFFYGNVVNMRDIVTFQGESVDQIRHAFKDSVDDYLDFCAQRGESPDDPIPVILNICIAKTTM